ncbi:MAG: choice-of-anchor Q domain-containing protein, partial [Leptolyngbyaceae cyanobacterium]
RNTGSANLVLSNATSAFNTAGTNGGGIFLNTTRNNAISNSLIASNVAGGSGPDISGNLANSTITHSLIQDTTGITAGAPTNGVDGNIVGQDPLLAPLADNGGPTQTHGLLTGSPAINAGGTGATTADQRGVAAIGIRDIGAFEGIVDVNIDPDLLFNRLDPLIIGEGVDGPILTFDQELAAELGILARLNDDGTLRPAAADDSEARWCPPENEDDPQSDDDIDPREEEDCPPLRP